MASSDYHLCHVCDRKAFYDADIRDSHYVATYDPSQPYKPIGIVVLCANCNEQYDILIQPKEVKV
jgi:hypothetical protein